MLAARVTLMVGGEPAGQAWSPSLDDDAAKSTQMNKRVAEAMGERELADVIQEGVDAHRAGDVEHGHGPLREGRAHGERLRQRCGDGADSKLVEIEDPVTGRVRPKAKVEEVDVLTSRPAPPGPRGTRSEATRCASTAPGEDG